MEIIAEFGVKAVAKLQTICAEKGVELAPLNVYQGDILQIDWSHSDIIVCNNVTWGPEMLT